MAGWQKSNKIINLKDADTQSTTNHCKASLKHITVTGVMANI
jgi:hypothetical protein